MALWNSSIESSCLIDLRYSMECLLICMWPIYYIQSGVCHDTGCDVCLQLSIAILDNSQSCLPLCSMTYTSMLALV